MPAEIPPESSSAPLPRAARVGTCWIVAGLVAVVVAVYARVSGYPFVDFDDGAYVYDNPPVRDGLTLHGLVWAFTTTHAANWHPLTWLSHMLDVQLFGLDAGWHHSINVLLHAASTALLFLVLQSATGARWRSALVAALFGLHPLHVESVAWVAERKDVLSALFWVLTLGAYVRHVRHAGGKLAVAGCFVLGLLAKPMLVTLPLALLLLDWWPLCRWSPIEAGAWLRLCPLVREKLPLLVLSVASCVVTYAAQASSGATGSLEHYALGARIANALVAYAAYLVKTVWPASLAVFYPHPGNVPLGQLLAAVVLLVLVSALVASQARGRPYLAVGWLWYLGTLVPTLGIVQVGSQALADRYAYLPSIGLDVAIVWAAGELCRARPRWRWWLASAGAVMLGALAVASAIQVSYWRDAKTLYQHAIAATDRNWLAWNNLGNQHLAQGELDRALECFAAALRIYPTYEDAWYNTGNVYLQRADRVQAIAAYERTLAIDATHLDAWNNKGVAHMNLGQYAEAIACYQAVLRLDPDQAMALQNLATTYALQGDRRRYAEFEQRLRAVDPVCADALRAQLGMKR